MTRYLVSHGARCTLVEPAPLPPESTLTLSRLRVRQLQAKAEAIPLPDGVFDGALAAWVLQYADDPSRAIRELARVCRRTPGTRAVVVQAAPMNDLVRLYNVCARALGQPESHHGYLLDLASETEWLEPLIERELPDMASDGLLVDDGVILIAGC